MEKISESELFGRIDLLGAEVNQEAYQTLSATRMEPSEARALNSLDPFGEEYRNAALSLYLRISKRNEYSAVENEKSGMGEPADIWRSASPFSFNDTKFVSEFLASWAAIFHALDVKAGASVLEYGPGSGQVLLLLARTGVKAYGVDIDADSLSLLRRQSEHLGLDVSLERAPFGKGFPGETFDRILFFEAFHHAFDFSNLLIELHKQLKPDGKLVFCGEPVVGPNDDAVPYPWGPRMDALSVLCIRRFGWMELGFRRDFFINALMSCGWRVTHQPNSVYRATTFIAVPWRLGTLRLGDALELPGNEWSDPEGTHRWTIAERAAFPLPWHRLTPERVVLTLANYLPEAKTVEVSAGLSTTSVSIPSGGFQEVSLQVTPDAREVLIVTNLTRLAGESRRLGVAVIELSLEA